MLIGRRASIIAERAATPLPRKLGDNGYPRAAIDVVSSPEGMGELSSLVTLVELGDVTRMHASRQAVRMAGLDIGVHRSDRHAQLGTHSPRLSTPALGAV